MTQHLMFQYRRLLVLAMIVMGIWVLNQTILTPKAQDTVDGQCSALATSIMESVTQTCEGIGRDQICYGSVSIDAEPNSDAIAFTFDSTGDVADVADLATLRLQSLNPDSSQWGVALMKVQSSLPDAAPEDVTLLLFGDVQIENLGQDIVRVPMVTTSGSNVRLRANATATLAGSVSANQEVTATGKLINPAGEEWIRIDLQSSSAGYGWMLGSLLNGDKDQLIDVQSSSSPAFGPMQAFTFQTGTGAGECDDVSNSGLMIQTPAGIGEVSFFINEVDIQVGSTTFLRAEPGRTMDVSTLEGNVRVESQGVTRQIPPGAQSSIPLNENGRAAGEPTLPEPAPDEVFQDFATFGLNTVFDEEFEVPDVFSEACIEDYNAEFNDNLQDPFGDEVSNTCFLENYALFRDVFLDSLPDSCFDADGSVLDECFEDFTNEIPAECYDEEGLLSELCLDADFYLESLPDACFNPNTGEVEDECIGAFDELESLPDSCFDEYGLLLNDCFGVSGIFYELPDTCYDDFGLLLDECLDGFGVFGGLGEIDDSCYDEYGLITDECLADEAIFGFLPDACFDEYGGIYDECLDPFEEFETIPDDCFDEYGLLLDECLGGVVDDDFGYGTIYRNEYGDFINPNARQFDAYGNPTYGGGYDAYGYPIDGYYGYDYYGYDYYGYDYYGNDGYYGNDYYGYDYYDYYGYDDYGYDDYDGYDYYDYYDGYDGYDEYDG